MGKQGVEEMIDEIEVFIESCKYQPLSSNKIVVPKDELERMLNELKLKLPSEIERCKKIMRNKEAILASARTRSDAIISESVNEANRLVDTNHITELANARANEILESARAEAQQIVDDANAEATEVRMGAMLYTKQKVTDIKQFLQSTLEAEQENYHNIIDSLENGIYTMDTNLNEVETSLALINNDPKAVNAAGAASYDSYDSYDEYDDVDKFDEPKAGPSASSSLDDDDDYDDDYDDDDEYDDDDDDFLDD
jgi:vacuolar-type H+-ATPase subunit H